MMCRTRNRLAKTKSLTMGLNGQQTGILSDWEAKVDRKTENSCTKRLLGLGGLYTRVHNTGRVDRAE